MSVWFNTRVLVVFLLASPCTATNRQLRREERDVYPDIYDSLREEKENKAEITTLAAEDSPNSVTG